MPTVPRQVLHLSRKASNAVSLMKVLCRPKKGSGFELFCLLKTNNCRSSRRAATGCPAFMSKTHQQGPAPSVTAFRKVSRGFTPLQKIIKANELKRAKEVLPFD